MAIGHTPAAMRDLNLNSILGVLHAEGVSSRADLAERLSLSRATLTHTLRELLALELISELDHDGALERTVGRQRTRVAINSDIACMVVADVGGTKTNVCIADANGVIRARVSIPTPKAKLDRFVAQLEHSIADGLTRAGFDQPKVAAIVIGVPGAVGADGRIGNAFNVPALEGQALGAVLTQHFGVQTLVENDVNMAAIGERRAGAMTDSDQFAYIAIGTGVGAGLLIGGQLLRGAHGFAGEFGELLTSTGETLEATVGGAGMVKRARQAGWSGPDAVALLSDARAGNIIASNVFEQAAQHLASGVLTMHTLLDLEAVVFGGGIGQQFALWEPTLRARLAGAHPRPPRLVRSSLSETATLHGGIELGLKLTWASLLQQAGMQRRLNKSVSHAPSPRSDARALAVKGALV